MASYSSLQQLHASLPAFAPLISQSLIPYLAWSLLLTSFGLGFYFTTLPKHSVPVTEILVALVASILGGFGTVAMFCTLGVYI
ncbi:SubName: Full=Uncharacterized protein {ECO:0000313/EMBL:CCA77868.1} [Serendipita indica DSM 11827]|uniref:Dolichyl-diphosphooligosaccharide-protein glycosyltransferase subunit OST5 n=1 Tax=Serendipita indica (strain DSM 11827) TaxID=1109443 RepID=G4U2T7_SERID|nr:SubName: Full=Uncharacterized protein {ECO:0000313/EMBL:CCA77868.1} [Serendipita indica DSM 11827]CCA77868.1 hypothetical protein PIIN_00514 [Serendipita indica DSM 11827]